jgi:hypothetical protein
MLGIDVSNWLRPDANTTCLPVTTTMAGHNPITLHDGENQSEHAEPQFLQTAQLLKRMSIAVIRVRNSLQFRHRSGDFEVPISFFFFFGQRIVWDARGSDASSPTFANWCAKDTEQPPGQGDRL